MHILVTGGCGYVGTQLVPTLLKEGYDVTVVDTMWFGNYLSPAPHLRVIQEDIRNTDAISFDGIDAVIHLANIANDPCVELDPVLSWEVNVLASQQLADKAVRQGVKQFIYASSGSVYGVKEELQVTENLSLLPISVYNKTKMVAERVFLSYEHDMTIQCIRPATVCGYSPRMRLDVSVNMLTMQALKNKKMTVFGGDQTRPNIHILDLVGVYLHFLKEGKAATGIYNAGFENLSILEIAQAIQQKVPSEIIVTPSNDPRSYRINSDKLVSTGFNPQYSVPSAINELVEKFNSGTLEDKEEFYNLKTMKTQNLSI